MKDESHHMTKFLRKMAKEEEPKSDKVLKQYRKEETEKQKKKQAKALIRKEKHTPIVETPKERNRDMKRRTPMLRKRSHIEPTTK